MPSADDFFIPDNSLFSSFIIAVQFRALALFPIKPVDKKAAFVLGLALAFKVPFDAAQLFAIRTFDPSDLFGLAVQGGLCLALFNHYGLVRALFQKTSNFGGLPPPPV